MENKKIITLDLTDCKYIMELHERIRIAFDFPECYGANWNAFWDFLRSEVDADEVIIIGENTMSKEFEKELESMHWALDEKVAMHKKYSALYDHIRPFTYRII
ncbi:MAG: barstar family protein [Clostridia bacterium]|nr:barstar family protein [Clostridia bacterium]MBQ6708269.1 barstar family protein [Clostridia bacterium]